MHAPETDPDFVLSLARGLQVIEAFSDSRDGLTVSELAARTNLSRAAVRRILITLESLGYANRKGTTFHLTSRILRLGFSFATSDSLAVAAGPLLDQLGALIHESCSVGVLENRQVVYIARSAPSRVMTIDLRVGSRLPAFYTSLGRVLLTGLSPADLEKNLAETDLTPLTPKTITDRALLREAIRHAHADGYALVDEELEVGLRSIAVPVVSRSGEVIAAMNSGVHAARVSAAELLERILPPLRDHAKLLEQVLP
jgi:IclR family pca regulon transcriptional regulator